MRKLTIPILLIGILFAGAALLYRPAEIKGEYKVRGEETYITLGGGKYVIQSEDSFSTGAYEKLTDSCVSLFVSNVQTGVIVRDKKELMFVRGNEKVRLIELKETK